MGTGYTFIYWENEMKGPSKHLPQIVAGHGLAAKSPAIAVAVSEFLIYWCQNTGIKVWKLNSAEGFNL